MPIPESRSLIRQGNDLDTSGMLFYVRPIRVSRSLIRQGNDLDYRDGDLLIIVDPTGLDPLFVRAMTWTGPDAPISAK